ncbi:MAG: ABC transporter permease subunit [Alphaproteobacteria bacterium]|nr:MAG: ABC transporter permease subunit [Alphaproteobacteria bacterium]
MADGARPLGPALWAGGAAALLLLALVLGPLAAVWSRAAGPGHLASWDLAALRFTLLQATLSAVLSCALAAPVARALARRRFRGRALVLRVLGVPFILPVIVAVLGILAVWGRAGWVSAALARLGLPPLDIYGLPGILLAHVFFNLPLAVRLMLQAIASVPAESWRLAEQLGFGDRAIWRHVEWPAVRRVLPGALATIFLLCVASFATVLALGGGPRATTLELAIWQAFRFEFDLGHAATLAAVQLALCAAAALIAHLLGGGRGEVLAGLDRLPRRWDGAGRAARAADALALVLLGVLVGLPMAAIVIEGLRAIGALPAEALAAAARSVAVGTAATALALGLGVALAWLVAALEAAGRPRWAAAVEGSGYLAIAASPMVLGVGLFILVFALADPVALALPLTALVNAVMAVPFVLRILLPAFRDAEARFGRLADALGIEGTARLRLLLLPRARGPIGFAAGLAAAFSIGDLGVIALFSRPESATLPMLLYELMGAYRMEAARAAALVLVLMCLAAFWLLDRGGRADDAGRAGAGR